MTQAATATAAAKVPEPRQAFLDAAVEAINRDLARACSLANVPDDIEEADTMAVRRNKLPMEALFSFKFETRSVRMKGNVNAGNIPVVARSSVDRLLDKLYTGLLDQHTSVHALRWRVAQGGFGKDTLYDGDYAVVPEQCGTCAGVGSYTCSPCGGAGKERCTNCLYSGWVNCVACNGYGGTTGGNGPSIMCMHCGGRGSKRCHCCNGSTWRACGSCGGHGTASCGGCAATGVVTTVFGASLSCAPELKMGKNGLPGPITAMARMWALGGFRDKNNDDPLAPHLHTATAEVTRVGTSLDFRIAFECEITTAAVDFQYEGKPASAIHSPLLFPTTVFTPFLDGKAARATDTLEGAGSPSAIIEQLRKSGFADMAEILKEDPDGFPDRVHGTSSGAISTATVAPIRARFLLAVDRFAKGARLRAWKLPVSTGILGWAACAQFGVLEWAASHQVPAFLEAISGLAALVTLAAASAEAKMAVRREAGTARGRTVGITGYAIALATAVLFWTTARNGITI